MATPATPDWLGPWPAVWDALACYRITRLVTQDHLPPVERARHALVRRSGDSPWGVLWTCPWCAGFWIALALVAGHGLAVGLAGERGHRAWTALMAPWALSAAAGLLSDREAR